MLAFVFPSPYLFVARLKRILRLKSTHGFDHLVIDCECEQPFTEVSEYYLSFSIDISVLAGGFWWEGSQKIRAGLGVLRIPPLDLGRNKFNCLTAGLAPAYLRVGGSEADKIHYLECPNDDKDALLLSAHIWDGLHQFLQRHQLKLYFTAKYGLFRKSEHGAWHGLEMRSLLEYSASNGYQIDVFELGNELNSYWIFYGLNAQPRAKQLADDYQTFSGLVKQYYPEAKIAGPGSAFWPKLGETVKPLSNISEQFLRSLNIKLDIVDWHYYPFQSKRTPIRTRTATAKRFLSPASFSDFSNFSQRLSKLRDTFQPQADLWTGETGSAQCGGERKLSDRFYSCFWWADQLGQGALHGQKVMIRQSLIGGDYGMIDRLTLKPRPDYWVSWLWKRLMGHHVFVAKCRQARIRCYLHQHLDGDRFTLLIINLTSQTQTPVIRGLERLKQQFALTAKTLRSRKVTINGLRPRIMNPDLSLEYFSKSKVLSEEIPPFSVNFWVFGSKSGEGLARGDNCEN